MEKLGDRLISFGFGPPELRIWHAEPLTLDRSKGFWFLATYLILGCVGIGIRLGSESSSGATAAGGTSGKIEPKPADLRG